MYILLYYNIIINIIIISIIIIYTCVCVCTSEILVMERYTSILLTLSRGGFTRHGRDRGCRIRAPPRAVPNEKKM